MLPCPWNPLRTPCTVAVVLAIIALSNPWLRGARADAELDKGLDSLAAQVAEFLQEESKGNAVNVGDFIAPPRLQASGGRGLSLSLIHI